MKALDWPGELATFRCAGTTFIQNRMHKVMVKERMADEKEAWVHNGSWSSSVVKHYDFVPQNWLRLTAGKEIIIHCPVYKYIKYLKSYELHR